MSKLIVYYPVRIPPQAENTKNNYFLVGYVRIQAGSNLYLGRKHDVFAGRISHGLVLVIYTFTQEVQKNKTVLTSLQSSNYNISTVPYKTCKVFYVFAAKKTYLSFLKPFLALKR